DGEESADVTANVTVALATPAITSPEDGDVVNEPVTEGTGTGLEGAEVTLEANGEEVGTPVEVVDGEWSFDVDLGFGEHELVASQVLDGEESADVTANVTVALATPAITSPEDGDVVNEPITEVTGTGLEGAEVTLEANGEEVGTPVEVVDGEWSIAVDLGYGEHELVASQERDGEESAEVTVNVTVAP